MNNPLFEDSKESIKIRRLLKVKLKKITNKIIKPYCNKYITKLRYLRNARLNNPYLIEKIINQSIHYPYGQSNTFSFSNTKRSTNLSNFDMNCEKLDKALKMELTKPEVQAIRNESLYFFPNYKIRNKIKILKESSLTSHIKEENITKNSLPNELIEKSIKYKLIEKTTSDEIKKLKEINNQIKFGILNLKNEEIKKNLINERNKNIVNILNKQARKEVTSFMNNVDNHSIINRKNKKIYLDECTQVNREINNENHENKEKYNKIIYPKIKKINLMQGNSSYHKKNPIINSNNSRKTNKIKIKSFASKSLDTPQKKTFKFIDNQSQQKILFPYSKKGHRGIKIKEIKFEDDTTKRALVILSNKIKDIYNKYKIKDINNKHIKKYKVLYKNLSLI